MGRKTWGAADKDDSGPVADLYSSTAVALSNLHHYLARRPEEVRFVRLVPRGESDYLAVMGVIGDDGTPLVVFGNGESWVDALRNLNASINAGKFKVDKFAR